MPYALQYADDDEDLGALAVPGTIVRLRGMGQDDGLDMPIIPMEPTDVNINPGLTPPIDIQPYPISFEPLIPMEPAYSPTNPTLTPPGALNIPASPMPGATNQPGGPITSMITAAGQATAAVVSVYPRQANSPPLPPGAIGYNAQGLPINSAGQVLNSAGLPSFFNSSTFGIPNVILIGGALIFAMALGGKR